MSFAPVVLAGPSGVGKGTVLDLVCRWCPQVWLSVSVTTRKPRPGEIDGEDYHFLNDSQFDDLVESDGLLEWATVHRTARYGTPRRTVEQKIAEGRAVVMELDVQGFRQVVGRLSVVRTVFLAPPSWEELERRLRGRGTESEKELARRLATAREEIAAQEEFDAVIVNTQVATAAKELVNFIGLGSAQSIGQTKD